MPKRFTPPLPDTVFPKRSLEDLGLTTPGSDDVFDGPTRLAARLFDVPTSLVCVIDLEQERRLVAGEAGGEKVGDFPYRLAPCRIVAETRAPCVVEDTRRHPTLGEGGYLAEQGVVAYLGVPVQGPGDEVVGALCVISPEARKWDPSGVAQLQDLAHCVSEQIRLRSAYVTIRDQAETLEIVHDQARRFNEMREAIVRAFTTSGQTAESRFKALLKAGCEALGADSAAITKVAGDHAHVISQYRVSGGEDSAEDGIVTGSVAAQVISGQDIVHCWDCADASCPVPPIGFDGSVPGCCIGAPLVLNGIIYGALEFLGREPRKTPWDPVDLSAAKVTAIYVTTQLEVYGQIDRLRKSESALLQYILDLRAGKAGVNKLS